MGDETTIEGDGISETLLASLENEDQKIWFQHYESAQRPLVLSDLELSVDAPSQTGGNARLGIALLGILAVLSGLVGAFPGPAAGIIPLAMDVLAGAGPLLAAFLAGLATLLALGSSNSAAKAPAPDFAKRRAIFPGSGPMTVQIGEVGIQLKFPNRFWRAHWPGFDAAAMMASDLNGGGLPILSKAEAGETTLSSLFAPDLDNPAIAELIEKSAIWAEGHDTLRLPVKVDKGFATRAGKSGSEALAPLGLQREFIVVDKRFFEAPNESALTWARFVAACIFMVQLKDPEWVDVIADDA